MSVVHYLELNKVLIMKTYKKSVEKTDENYYFSAFRLVINKPNHHSLLLILGFSITVTIWLREVVSCRDFILRCVATFWVVSLVGIYPGRASNKIMTNYPHIALPEPNILILSCAPSTFFTSMTTDSL